MITPIEIRELALSTASAPGRPLHLSAASGLVCVGSFIYVIADDELHLGVFRSESRAPGDLICLFDGELPDSKSDRKKRKPDLEALALLPPDTDFPHGALLALGSGSRRNRRNGALLALDAQGGIRSAPRVIDLSPLLVPLEELFPALNIEGAVVNGEEVRLFQRGNVRHPDSAMIRFHLSDLVALLRAPPKKPLVPIGIVKFDLGYVDGVPYTFTDATVVPDGRIVFTAVAENSADAYDDGACVGAAVGVISREGRLRGLFPLTRPYKIEGVDARAEGDVIRLLLVTDADDDTTPAKLLSATIPG